MAEPIVDTSVIKMPINARKKPVIVGTGLAGLAISKQLGNHRIAHYLIGPEVGFTRPKLGESVEILGVYILEQLFPKLRHHFHPKRGIDYHIYQNICRLDFTRCFELPWMQRHLANTGYPRALADGLIHLDRSRFDQEAYQDVINSRYCVSLDCKVVELDYDKRSDKIESVLLDNGERIAPRYVFDATNAFRLLPKMLGLEPEVLSGELRIMFTHILVDTAAKDQLSAEALPWLNVTNVLRHYEAVSGFEGTSWCIPVDDYVSIGTSTPNDVTLSNDEILRVTFDQFRKRGIDIEALFKRRTEIQTVRTYLYYYPKAHGGNWLLTAGCACQPWFTTVTGVESSMFVANMAQWLIRFPKFLGEYYSSYVKEKYAMHEVMRWFHDHAHDGINERDSYLFMIRAYRAVGFRYMLGMMFTKNPLRKKYSWYRKLPYMNAPLDEKALDQNIELVKQGQTCAGYVDAA